MRRALLVVVALVFGPGAASPQGPVGPEFRVNTYTTHNQSVPSVGADAAGNFAVVWQSFGQDGGSLFGQRYDSGGAPLGPEFRVNTYTTAGGSSASVARDPSGAFVVVWQSYQEPPQPGPGLHAWGIFGQRYSSSGVPLGSEFHVNTYTTSNQQAPSVAVDGSGNFVVVWESFGQEGYGAGSRGVFGQRYASGGVSLGPEFRVNTYQTLWQVSPSVARDLSGGFVVVWQSESQDGSFWGIFGQRYASSGVPLGPEFRVNTYTTFVQAWPAVATDGAGNFVVVWESWNQDGHQGGIFGQRYSSSGAPLGPEFRINTYTTYWQIDPSVAADSFGNFVVVWESFDQFPTPIGLGIFGQRYSFSGAALGPEFLVNTHVGGFGSPSNPSVAAPGTFVVVWESRGQEGNYGYAGVFGQRYGTLGGAILSVDDVTVTEVDAGSVNATFTVSVSAAATQTVTAQYATTDVTAVAALDYVAANGTVTFPPGTVSQTISVPVLGDLLDEDDETFTVNLSNATNATIADGQGIGTIVDNDPLPTLSVNDCAVIEGNAGSTPCPFTITLAPISGRTVTANYATADGTAIAGSDYTVANGTVTIPASTTQQTVNVSVLGDTTSEPDETFFLDLSVPSFAVIADGQGAGTILSDELAPSLSNLEVGHGSDVTSDFTGGTPDHYRLSQRPLSSYEVLLDSLSGDAVPGLLLERLAADNTTVVQTAVTVGTGSALSLRWANTLAATVNGETIRLRSPACGTNCGADDIYRMRVHDTTFSLARFNNSGSQVTVVLLQNPTSHAVSGHIHFWGTSGALLLSQAATLAPRAALVLNTATLLALQSQGGSVTVSHDAPYAALAGKSVALEPATGFSFDSPLEARGR